MLSTWKPTTVGVADRAKAISSDNLFPNFSTDFALVNNNISMTRALGYYEIVILRHLLPVITFTTMMWSFFVPGLRLFLFCCNENFFAITEKEQRQRATERK